MMGDLFEDIRRIAGIDERAKSLKIKPGEKLYTLDGKKGVWRTVGGARIFTPTDGSAPKSGRGSVKPSDVGITGKTDFKRLSKGSSSTISTPSAKLRGTKLRGSSAGFAGINKEKTVAPKTGKVKNVDPTRDSDGDGVTDRSRVGVGASEVPPPPRRLPRLPNLTADERYVEEAFAERFERDPDGVAQEYLDAMAGGLGEAPNVFNTDDAKELSDGYNPKGLSKEKVLEHKSRYNTAVHATGNAIAKRAFVKYLDDVVSKLPEERRSIAVTSGGVAAGKGFAIEKGGLVGEGEKVSDKYGAIWDAAGEQNATENPWLLEEAEKRGIRATFFYVHAEADKTWALPGRGVVDRASKKGRMVDARVFADSYALGPRNFESFRKKNEGRAKFAIIDNTADYDEAKGTGPKEVDEMPKSAFVDAEKVYATATKVIGEREGVPPAIRRGGTLGQRIWGGPKETSEGRTALRRSSLFESKKPKKKGKFDDLDNENIAAVLKNMKAKSKTGKDYDADKLRKSMKVKRLSGTGLKGEMPELNDDGSIKE